MESVLGPVIGTIFDGFRGLDLGAVTGFLWEGFNACCWKIDRQDITRVTITS